MRLPKPVRVLPALATIFLAGSMPALACSDATGNPCNRQAVNMPCTTPGSATKEGDTWHAVVHITRSRTEEYVANGTVCRVTNVTCGEELHCYISGAPASWTASDAVAECRRRNT